MTKQRLCRYCRGQVSAYSRTMRFCCKSHAASWQQEQRIEAIRRKTPWVFYPFTPVYRPAFDYRDFRVAV